jgi:ubiquinone/menaquinone biosynthesis C-methylase UbiE
MDTREAYNSWARQYDTTHNRTRDLEAVALKETVGNVPFETCLEIGCGTGKNTAWLHTLAKHITAVDLSDEMLARAKEKIQAENVHFRQANISQPWTFADRSYDLVTFSLVLEHTENIADIMQKVAAVIAPGGHVYIGELHPFKQYAGTKACFEGETGTQFVDCFNHNISDFTQAAKQYGFAIVNVNEFFDNNDRAFVPRILALLLRKCD